MNFNEIKICFIGKKKKDSDEEFSDEEGEELDDEEDDFDEEDDDLEEDMDEDEFLGMDDDDKGSGESNLI